MDFTLPATAAAAGRARETVRGVLTSWGLDGEADTATLLVSELVTNAIRHAGSSLGVSLVHTDDCVRVAVTDGEGDQLPHLVEPDLEAEGGRGLWLVDLLASAWGISKSEHGKAVWFELGPHRPALG